MTKNNKDWTGNKKSTFVILGASNHTDHERAEYDYYATEPKAIDALLEVETFDKNIPIWENCCGEGHLSKRLEELGYTVISTDLIDRGYGQGNVDFFEQTKSPAHCIITNPPYAKSLEWVNHSLELLSDGDKLALFLPITFLEADKRVKMFEKTPPKRILVAANRLLCGMNGDFAAKDKDGNTVYDKDGNPKRMSSAKCYAWFVWVKGDYSLPVIQWINKTKEAKKLIIDG